ncbi:2-C-methyl-D-erythritol 2,4-cyclodiphosphate synthase, putative [Theileria equi strain WA]|uniref:2-C-methyl-D-erythritol 2,4-cyclodiphosphate synthase n=1 Tax=Theileria equi strain WA TaxID=1537102 RepID=L1LBS4_THEEQ|nr:2-C-methyl-D-erythritol 2,4-cyclodiphosphate synthase, putative [Theileria equi strain WA]EKX72887.1 2-C-methyl-D-erythritol 2,4-cyclodiphosphate synthase, putative [Theileria equi strain WA]|eukprot:XP_004832339.1 2-C-methyl-D-erythritol 2,4-cyclodiphosphate synthase, putative [Theileria equi strain WA]
MPNFSYCIALILISGCLLLVEAFRIDNLGPSKARLIRTPIGTFSSSDLLSQSGTHYSVNERYRIYSTGILANSGYSQGRGNGPFTTRVGFGYDLHRLVKDGADGKTLIIGGVKIPDSEFLVVGHSDGDVLLHSVSDAILGALGKGDIGDYFPDNNAEYKDYDSSKILALALEMASELNYRIQNIDTCLILERPKLGPFKDKIKQNLQELVGKHVCINVKAKTNEKLDSLGENKAIACHSVVLLERGG